MLKWIAKADNSQSVYSVLKCYLYKMWSNCAVAIDKISVGLNRNTGSIEQYKEERKNLWILDLKICRFNFSGKKQTGEEFRSLNALGTRIRSKWQVLYLLCRSCQFSFLVWLYFHLKILKDSLFSTPSKSTFTTFFVTTVLFACNLASLYCC